MSSETVTRNDLTAILNEVLPNPSDMTPQEVEDFVDGLNVSGTSVTALLHDILVIDTNTATLSLPASDVGSVSVDMTKSGYTLIAIAGVKVSGSGSSLGYVYSFFVNSATQAVVYFRNTTATARTYTVGVDGLYLKNA